MSQLAKPEISVLIVSLRGHRVILDSDLASLYGVTTKRLNEQVKRNQDRFPADFMFQLTAKELQNLRSQFATSSQQHGGRRYMPFAFSEHGALMAANVLNSPQAVKTSVDVVRAFISLRRMALSVEALSHKIRQLEKKYDGQFQVVFQAFQQLLTKPDPPKRKIGFDAP